MATAATVDSFLPLVKGNVSAAEFLALIVGVLHFWDDLIDKDKVVDDETINQRFFELLVSLPRNAFYAQHFDHLNPILVNAITNWHVANRMEKTQAEYQLRIAYILRSSYCDLITQSAMLVGGPDHAREVGYANRMNAHKETWEGYQTNLAAEFAAREKKE